MSATQILIELLGAVALLLWGLRMVRTGMTRAFGADLRRLLGRSLRNRFVAFLAGLAVTGVMQSSTAVASMTASFAGRGLVATAPALAVMLGADVGTTLVAQALAFELGWLAPLLAIFGLAAFLLEPTPRIRHLGRVGIGLALMLIALGLIAGQAEVMQQSSVMLDVLGVLGGEPVLAVLLGAGLTWLAHSSLATVLFVMALAGNGAIGLPLALALVVGANVGGTLPAIGVTWADGPEARRVTLGNACFRLIGAAAVLPWLDQIALLLPQLEAALPRQVVDFHTGFNLAVAAVFILLTDLAAALATRALPSRAGEDGDGTPRFLDRSCLDTPNLALACAARETIRLADITESMLVDALQTLQDNDSRKIDELSELDNAIDQLHEAIKLYLTALSRQDLDETESRRCMEIMAFNTNLEHVGDIIDHNLLEVARRKTRKQLRFSDAGWREIAALHAHVADSLKLAVGVFMSGDQDMARRLLAAKVTIRDEELAATESHLARLRAGTPESIDTSALHLDALRDLKRIHSHLTAVAYPVLERTGELRPSRLRGAGEPGRGHVP